MDNRDRIIMQFIADYKNASARYCATESKIDPSNYFEWSSKSMMNASKFIGNIEGLIQILEIEYRYSGGELND